MWPRTWAHKVVDRGQIFWAFVWPLLSKRTGVSPVLFVYALSREVRVRADCSGVVGEEHPDQQDRRGEGKVATYRYTANGQTDDYVPHALAGKTSKEIRK